MTGKTKQKIKLLSLFVLVIIIDQSTKSLAYAGRFGGFLVFFKPFFNYLLFKNYYFAFSLPIPANLSFFIYTLLIIGLVYYFFILWKQSQLEENSRKIFLKETAVVFILSGALSNIYDRLAFGYVRDFIYVFWGNVFNFADIVIVLGIIILLFT